MNLPADILEKISKAQASKGGERLRHGVYTLALRRLYIEKGYKGWAQKADLVVMESQPLASAFIESDKTTHPCPKGFEYTEVWRLDEQGDKGEAQKSGAKTFVLALLGQPNFSDTDEKAVKAYQANLVALCEFVGSEKGGNVGHGALIRASTFNQTTRKGEVHVRKNWIHVDQGQEEVEATRKALREAK